MAWAAMVGCLAGLSAIAFRAAISGTLWCWTQRKGDFETVAAQLPWWQRLLIPAGGGLLAGLVLHFGAKLRHGHRTTDYMEAVAVQKGAMSIRSSLTKTASSLLTIGSGGSIGREGAMVQLSAMLASWFGESIRLSTPRLRLIVACGAAGGLVSVYNVTVAGALFVSEIILGSIAVESLAPLLVAAAASSVVSKYVAKTGSYFVAAPFHLTGVADFVPFAIMAVALGAAAPGYVWLLGKSEDWLTKLAPPVYLRLALGGLIVGVLAVPFPQMWGNGRSMVSLVLTNPWSWTTLAAILACKVIATAATTGSGAVGGVFTPTLFTGAMLGCLFGQGAQSVWHGGPSAEMCALLGMGGFMAAATRAPLMAMLMVLEMTRDYESILPLMPVCVLSYYVARSLHSDSIYSASLRRKQPRSTPADISALQVRHLIKRPPPTVTEKAPFADVVKRFASTPYRHLWVTTSDRQLRGFITLRQVEDYLENGKPTGALSAADLMRTGIPAVTPEASLAEALEDFKHYDAERMPVINDKRERILLGHVTKTDVLLTLSHGLKGSTH